MGGDRSPSWMLGEASDKAFMEHILNWVVVIRESSLRCNKREDM